MYSLYNCHIVDMSNQVPISPYYYNSPYSPSTKNNMNGNIATAPPMDDDEVTIGIYYKPPVNNQYPSQQHGGFYTQPTYPPPIYSQSQSQSQYPVYPVNVQPQQKQHKNKEDECCCIGIMALLCFCCVTDMDE